MNTYIHIPFCTQKCTYCKFALTPIFNNYKIKKYIHFLWEEIEEKIQLYLNEKIKTIYFGWWTPSILSVEELRRIIHKIPHDGSTEITLESNPEDIHEAYLEWIFWLWINRLSIWIQSLNNETLKEVQRKNSESIFSALESIKNILVWKVGKRILNKNKEISINIDLILGLPFTKKWEILSAIQYLHENYTFITHTSVYVLEKWLYPEHWMSLGINEEEIRQEYWDICNYFSSKWWNHYEVSNFAKPGHECKHNLGYWNHENSLGFWLSAAEFIKTPLRANTISEIISAKRSINSISFSGYYKGVLEEQETLNNSQILLEDFLFCTRTFKEINTNIFTFLDRGKIKKFLQEWLIIGNEKIFTIPEKSILMLDFIVNELVK